MTFLQTLSSVGRPTTFSGLACAHVCICAHIGDCVYTYECVETGGVADPEYV